MSLRFWGRREGGVACCVFCMSEEGKGGAWDGFAGG